MIKKERYLQRLGIERTYLNIIKAIYNQPTVNFILNGEKLKAFLSRYEQDKGFHCHHFLFNIVLEVLGMTFREVKEIKGIHIGEEDKQDFHIENTKDATRKLLELINEFGKVIVYKMNTQKSLAFLYTDNGRSEREIKDLFHLSLQQKN